MAGGAEPFDIERASLALGSEANIALCDLGAEWTVGEDGYESRSSNSWCDGRKLTGRVLMTLAGGQVAKGDRVEWLAISDHQQAVNALLAGETVFQRNDYGDTLFCIVSGSVQIEITDDRRPHAPPRTTVWEAGDFFGEAAATGPWADLVHELPALASG